MGVGTLLLEGTTLRHSSLVNLRSDYGSSWRGDLVIRKCVLQPPTVGSGLSLLTGKNNGQHHYGHSCSMPETITIDVLRIEDGDHPEDYEGPAVLGNFNPGYKTPDYVEKFPYTKTRKITIKDVTVASGKSLATSKNPVMFRDVDVERSGRKQ